MNIRPLLLDFKFTSSLILIVTILRIYNMLRKYNIRRWYSHTELCSDYEVLKE